MQWHGNDQIGWQRAGLPACAQKASQRFGQARPPAVLEMMNSLTQRTLKDHCGANAVNLAGSLRVTALGTEAIGSLRASAVWANRIVDYLHARVAISAPQASSTTTPCAARRKDQIQQGVAKASPLGQPRRPVPECGTERTHSHPRVGEVN